MPAKSAKPKYGRVLLKLSGESFSSSDGATIDAGAIGATIDEMEPVLKMGVEIAAVVGGGNLIRARDFAGDETIQRVTADQMGMLGTAINALALRDGLEARGISARVMSAISMPAICETYSYERAMRHMEKGRIVLFAGGTGSPFFTTDTTAALRAAETGCRLLVKATKVDGVYDADPMVSPSARKFDRMSYQDVIGSRLGVMDLTAVSLCEENRIPIVVCQLFNAGNLQRAIRGEAVGTIIGG